LDAVTDTREKAKIRKRWIYLYLFTLLALIYVLVVNAWVVDDAYITFRTVDNFVHGHGLRWNVDERVQVYTHPLWLMVMTAVYFVTREEFFSSMTVCFLLSLGTFVYCTRFLTRGYRSDLWKAPLFVLGMVASKSVIDYASSGLENALSYAIVALFIIGFLRDSEDGREPLKQLRRSLFLASLIFLNRPDLVLLFAPAVVYLFFGAVKSTPVSRLVATVLVATLPATLWIVFSLVYYGFPFPNTAYAKSLSTGIPVSWKLQRGLDYAARSLRADTVGHLAIIAACVVAVIYRARHSLFVMCGVVLYFGFVVYNGAAATHMNGRFFSVIIFVAVLVLIRLLKNKRIAAGFAGLCVAYIAWSPVSAVKFGTSAYKMYPVHASGIDAKQYVYNEGAALINWRPGKRMPDHEWFRYGEDFLKNPRKFHIGGASGGDGIGYLGFAVGPDKYIIDRVALSEPFLARLPAFQPPRYEQWKSGHFYRPLPPGYLETIAYKENRFPDKDLGRYYDIIQNITRGSVFRWGRFKDIWNINLGRYSSLIAAYDPQRAAAEEQRRTRR
jgi:arabinofuranosyltransferase